MKLMRYAAIGVTVALLSAATCGARPYGIETRNSTSVIEKIETHEPYHNYELRWRLNHIPRSVLK